MPALLTLQVVDEALDNLNLKDGTLKAELAKAIRSSFSDDTSLQTITSLPTDDLVLTLWGTGSAEELRARRKNFSSLKSALNKSLKDLDRAGKNPAGIVIGRDNVFSVSEERKDDLIRQLGISADSPNIFHDMLEAFRRFFSEAAKEKSAEEIRRMLASLEQTGSDLRQMAGLPQEAPPPATEATPPVLAEEEPSETIELLDGDEIEVVEVSVQAENGEDQEETPLLETTTIMGQELIEEIAEEELLEDAQSETQPEADAFEVVELAEDEGLLPTEEGMAAEAVDEADIVEIEDADTIPEEEPDEILPEDDALEMVELAEDEGLLPTEEGMAAEAVDAADIVEIDEADTIPEEEPGEILPEDDALEMVELAEDEGLFPTEEGMAAEAVDEADIVEIEDADTIPEEAPGEILPEDDALEVVELAEDEGLFPTEEGMAAEAVDEADIVEIDDADTIPDEAPGEILPGDDALEVVELAEDEGLPQAEEVQADEFEDAEILGQELAEDISEEELPEAGMEEEFLEEELRPEEDDEKEKASRSPAPLEILSKYIEANEALTEERELLRETQEEFINQILDRFMPKFIKIPAGVYPVGSLIPQSLEQPLRKVPLAAFYLGQTPVTNDLFDFFVRETGYVTDAEEAGYGVVYEGRCTRKVDPATGRELLNLTSGTVARHVSGANWRHPDGPNSSLEGRHDHPVVQVSHADAMAFAAWAGKRLPTEEEWEAAARGPEGRLFPWGHQWQDAHGNFESSCLGATTAVDHYGRKGMGPFGIQDLMGNVAEWTATPFSTGTGADTIYILKGGSWISSGVVQASSRQIERGKHWTNTIGFRCAVSS